MSTATLHTATKKALLPQLRFPEFEGEWEKEALSELSTKITDGTHDTPKPIKEGVPFLTAIHIKDGFVDYNNCYYLEQEVHNSIYKRCNPEKDDLLIVNIGAGTATCAINSVDYEFSLKNVALVKPNKEIVNGSFLAQIQRKKSTKIFNQLTSGGAQPFLSLKEIGRLKISFPTLPEQQKIASFLSAVDEKIQQLSRKKGLLEQYKKGVMQQLFSGKLRFKDENGKDFPDWEEKKLKEIVLQYRLGGNYTNTLEVTEYPLIKMGNLGRGLMNINKLEYIPVDEIIDSKDKIEYGDLFFNTRNTLDLVGKVSIWRNELPIAYYNSNLMYLKFQNNFFMNYRLNSQECINGLRRFATGTTSVAAIYTKDLLKLKINMPCLEEQQKIANFLSGIDAKIENTNQQMVQAQRFKKGLLQQMFV